MWFLLSSFVVAVAGTFTACQPCSQNCDVPCRTPVPALPIVWDNTHEDQPAIKHGQFNLNPYNSIRPEYRDAPPSQADLEKIWQHHLKDHAYKSPFVRPMKSGLWEAGVPNRYAPSGYNRRKFKSEEEALAYVRHKTGAGANIDYQGALKSEAEIKGNQLRTEDVVFEKGVRRTVRRHGFKQHKRQEASKEDAVLMEMSSEASSEASDEPSTEAAFMEMSAELSSEASDEPSTEAAFLEMSAEMSSEASSEASDEPSTEAAFIEMSSTISQHAPTKDMDIAEKAASTRDLAVDDKVLDVEGVHTRATRDHNLKIAHKMRDFLSNYRPDHDVKVVDHGFES